MWCLCFVELVCPPEFIDDSFSSTHPPQASTSTSSLEPFTINIPSPTMTIRFAIGWRLLSSIMARQTIGRWLVCLSVLCLFGNGSAFVAPLLQHAKVWSSIPSILLSTTDEAAIDIESFAAPLIEIERRRNLAIISHPDSGEELVLVCASTLFC